mgnify:CR=1 FL=1
MLFIEDEIIKLGGVILSGQVKSVEITQEATIDEIEDDKGQKKASQPVGYGAAKITIDFILEDGSKSTLEQIADMQRLFKDYGQTAARLLPIVNEDCSARGITEVYFKSLGRTASLVLETPTIASIQTQTVETETEGTAGSGQQTGSTTGTAGSGQQTGGTTRVAKTTKDTTKSPAHDIRAVKRGNNWDMIY